MNIEVSLSAEEEIRVFTITIGKEIECEDNGTVGRVLEWNDSVFCFALLNCVEDIYLVISRLKD